MRLQLTFLQSTQQVLTLIQWHVKVLRAWEAHYVWKVTLSVFISTVKVFREAIKVTETSWFEKPRCWWLVLILWSLSCNFSDLFVNFPFSTLSSGFARSLFLQVKAIKVISQSTPKFALVILSNVPSPIFAKACLTFSITYRRQVPRHSWVIIYGLKLGNLAYLGCRCCDFYFSRPTVIVIACFSHSDIAKVVRQWLVSLYNRS